MVYVAEKFSVCSYEKKWSQNKVWNTKFWPCHVKEEEKQWLQLTFSLMTAIAFSRFVCPAGED